jgi:3-phenylpropionate/trans-cinnamate dioxygenase ferredoxin reductase component
MSQPRRVTIVGAGLAGSRCAETLRAEGFAGAIELVGAEVHPPYERPALSKELLCGARDDISLRPVEHWAQLGIDLQLGRRVERLHDVHADAVVIATGACARRVPGFEGVHVLRTLDDALALREELRPGRRLVVIGAGFVGAEVASTAVSLGVQVTLLEAARVPLERVLGSEVGGLLAERYRAHGVDLRLGAKPTSVAPGRVLLADGNALEPDAVLLAVGAVPSHPGIETDGCGRTARSGVFACGDVTAWHRASLGGPVRVEHWADAAGQGATVARTILGDPHPYDPPPYFWSDQFGLRLQQVGRASSWTSVALDGEPDEFTARYLDAQGRPLAVLLANRPHEAAAARRELAAAA